MHDGCGRQSGDLGAERGLEVGVKVCLPELSVQILLRHAQGAVQSIPENIRQFLVIAEEDPLIAHVTVLPGRDLGEEKITQRIGSDRVGDGVGINHVAKALAHFFATRIPPAMHKKPWYISIRKATGVQHDRPVNAVGGDQNILPNNMQDIGPLPGFFKRRQPAAPGGGISEPGKTDIVRQGVEPDIGHIVTVKGQLDSPGQAAFWPGDAQVHALALNGIEKLREPVSREDGVRVGLQILAQPRQVGGEFEIPVFFLQLRDLAPFRTEIAGGIPVLVRQVLFLTGTVKPAGVLPVKLSLIMELLEQGLDDGGVPGIGSRHPAIIFHFQPLPQGGEFCRDSCDIRLRGEAGLFSRLLHLLPMLVYPGQKIDGLPCEPLEACDGICQYFFVGMADVRSPVGVIDGGGNEKWLGHGVSLDGCAMPATGKGKPSSLRANHALAPPETTPPGGHR